MAGCTLRLMRDETICMQPEVCVVSGTPVGWRFPVLLKWIPPYAHAGMAGWFFLYLPMVLVLYRHASILLPLSREYFGYFEKRAGRWQAVFWYGWLGYPLCIGLGVYLGSLTGLTPLLVSASMAIAVALHAVSLVLLFRWSNRGTRVIHIDKWSFTLADVHPEFFAAVWEFRRQLGVAIPPEVQDELDDLGD